MERPDKDKSQIRINIVERSDKDKSQIKIIESSEKDKDQVNAEIKITIMERPD